MRDVREPGANDVGTTVDGASDEIARSLGSVWQRFSGQRPKSTEVEMGADVVRCVITGRDDSAPDEEPSNEPGLSPAGLKYNATAAIERITGRRVIAFITKDDKSAQINTQTFRLDRPPQRF